MANIVGAFGTSHGPLLTLTPDQWHLREQVDRTRKHAFRGGTYSFDQLVELRAHEGIGPKNTLEARTAFHARCQTHLDALGDMALDLDPDILVIVGDDQHEWFSTGIQPAFTVFNGDKVLNSKYDLEKIKDWHVSRILVEKFRHTEVDTYYDCVPDLANHIIARSVADQFDINACPQIPEDKDGPIGIGHAFTFIYRRILRDRAIPLVPILVNTFYPPNQPSAKRCYEFGKAIGRAINSWDSGKRVALFASGGLSHYVIDEPWDERMIRAIQARDEQAIAAEPEVMFRSGTSETKNWLVVAGAMAETGMNMNMLDYVPCYRSAAGTGNAMAFATWR